MKNILSCLILILVTGCIDSPLVNHVNADDLKNDKAHNLLLNSGIDCPFFFSTNGLCAKIEWKQKPTDDEAGSFEIYFWKKADGDSLSGPFITPTQKIGAKLWMPSMGHGSSPIKVSQSVLPSGETIAGKFLANNAYFMMHGSWELWIQLKDGTKIVEEQKIDLEY